MAMEIIPFASICCFCWVESRELPTKTPQLFFEMVAQLRFIMINKLEDPGSTEPNTHLKDVINISIISKVTVTHFEVTVTRSFKVKVQEQPPLRYSFLVGWVNQPILNNMIVKIGS